MKDVCIAGNPAVDGCCGDRECVCARATDGGRTGIGNTPTCESCGESLDHCSCEELEAESSIYHLLLDRNAFEARNVVRAAADHIFHEGYCDEFDHAAVTILDKLRFSLYGGAE